MRKEGNKERGLLHRWRYHPEWVKSVTGQYEGTNFEFSWEQNQGGISSLAPDGRMISSEIVIR
jgi:hypothetical protein